LGDYIIEKNTLENLSEQLVQQIADREARLGKSCDPNQLSDIVSASHFSEVLDLAVQAASNTSDEELLSKIRKYAHDINLTTIRNSLSHANRDYKLQYWYLAASLGTLPEIESLGLKNVIENVISAENDDLKEPPKEWLAETSNKIPNNLPAYFEHDSTGLVGRNREAKELTKLILNKRVNTIAVVAPGGVGKTALVLDLLHNLSFTTETANNFNGLIFVSLKTEELTPNGIKSLSAIQSLEELKNAILDTFNDLWNTDYDNFDSLISSDIEHKPLLFIDNLETLIRDNESIFNDFNSSLPYDWKVLITSRINVSTAKTLPLPTLSSPAASQLAREYQKNKGSLPLNQDEIDKVINNCNFNPLAIKLTLDYWSLGNSLPTAWQKANSGIAEFSFKNLISSLSSESIEVLELLFTADRCSRKDICNLLSINIDESAKAISELSKTSLIRRITEADHEYYEINASIRDFLLVSPKNINVRQKVQTNIRKNKDRAIEIIRLQNTKNISEYSENFIPEHIDETLKINLHKVNKLCHQKSKGNVDFEKITDTYTEFQEIGSVYNNDYLYQRTLARLYTLMHDNINAKASLLKAYKINSNDVATAILLAKSYHEEREYDESEKIYTKLLEKTDIRNDRCTWYSILNGYYICLLHQSKYEMIFDSTKKWRDDSQYGSTLGTYRASAFKRKIETQIENNETDELYKSFNSALKIMHTVLKESGYFFVATREAYKIIDSISYYFFNRRNSLCAEQVKSAHQLLTFCDEHIKDIYQKQNKDTSELYKFVKHARSLSIDNNPFSSTKWDIRKSPSEEIGVSFNTINSCKKFVRTKVQNIPNDNGLRKPFIFTEDAYKKRYFVHRNTFKNGENVHFYSLEVGDDLAIMPEKIAGRELEQSIETYHIK
ncbi:hypothetical protein MD588_24405, partial [Photobacterium sp. SDRW27]|uniref:hypothetical protein n=1 Tax=Photobacterium obscurum TaxID=2829490 RepID=UPI0022434A19